MCEHDHAREGGTNTSFLPRTFSTTASSESASKGRAPPAKISYTSMPYACGAGGERDVVVWWATRARRLRLRNIHWRAPATNVNVGGRRPLGAFAGKELGGEPARITVGQQRVAHTEEIAALGAPAVVRLCGR